jgi:chromosome partitioning protein
MALANDTQAPDFELANQFGERVRLSEHRGHRAVALVFFPLAFSGTCTGEMCQLEENLGLFADSRVELIGISDANYRLHKVLAPLKAKYDLILIDCPPSLEMLTLNGLSAADEILVPVQCEYYALEGLSDLMATLRMVKKRINPSLSIFGVVLTMYDGRTNFSAQVAEEVRRHFPGKVFTSVIPRNIRLAEAPSHGIPVNAYDRSSRGAVAYKTLAEEIHKKL